MRDAPRRRRGEGKDGGRGERKKKRGPPPSVAEISVDKLTSNRILLRGGGGWGAGREER